MALLVSPTALLLLHTCATCNTYIAAQMLQMKLMEARRFLCMLAMWGSSILNSTQVSLALPSVNRSRVAPAAAADATKRSVYFPNPEGKQQWTFKTVTFRVRHKIGCVKTVLL
jgi:hypothetical protein